MHCWAYTKFCFLIRIFHLNSNPCLESIAHARCFKSWVHCLYHLWLREEVIGSPVQFDQAIWNAAYESIMSIWASNHWWEIILHQKRNIEGLVHSKSWASGMLSTELFQRPHPHPPICFMMCNYNCVCKVQKWFSNWQILICWLAGWSTKLPNVLVIIWYVAHPFLMISVDGSHSICIECTYQTIALSYLMQCHITGTASICKETSSHVSYVKSVS